MSFLITLLWILATPAAQPQAEDVRFTGEDGFVLTGTYYPAASDGPGIVLMHQCSGGSRGDFGRLARLLAGKGFHALAFDFRGFGDSRNEKFHSFHQQMEETEALWPADVEAAYRFLLSQPGVDQKRSGVLGASCGSSQAVLLAQRHQEVKAIVLLSGSLTTKADEIYGEIADRATFCLYSEQDGYGTPDSMKTTFDRSRNAASELLVYKGSRHGAELFKQDLSLPENLVDWFDARLRVRQD
jgi:dienelactone hydrolase